MRRVADTATGVVRASGVRAVTQAGALTRPRHNIIKNDLRHSLRLLCFARYVSLVRVAVRRARTDVPTRPALNSVTGFYGSFVFINSALGSGSATLLGRRLRRSHPRPTYLPTPRPFSPVIRR